jgi:N-acetylglucosamine-6-phosphate deacetylase
MAGKDDELVWVKCDTLFTPFQRLEGCLLGISGSKIVEISEGSPVAPAPSARLIHEPGALVAPGFIDLHVHGAGGRDLMDGTLESLQTVAETLARHGTTSFLATTMSAPDPDLEVAVRGFANHLGRIAEGAIPLGLHLEGPYLNPVRKGTHNASYLALPNIHALRRFVSLSNNSVRKITIAPELDHALSMIREVARMGIQISMGHSDATEEEARAAVEAGATQATHVFNAMRPLHQREPGILGHVLNDARVFAEVIADGVHVHPSVLKLLLRMKGVDRTILITDGLSAVDMPEGKYPLGDKLVVVERGACRDPDGGLAGSILTLDRAVKNLVDWLELPLHEAFAASSSSPARSMGWNSKGVIAVGADADLVFLDQDLQVVKTMVGGKIVYSKK